MEDTVIVHVKQGWLRGLKETTKSGANIYSFRGIPYARPPVGALRFKAPLPPQPWDGVRDALDEAPYCVQLHMVSKEVRGSEDCLYLNVFTSQVAARRRPVMVYIHGGGFQHGSGDGELFGPDYLVDAGVLVVTFNYRVGPLGFLSLNNEAVSGNMGLKDQTAALSWTRDNVAAFGGDPDNVTVFGESAGGASVHYHLLSPGSSGLFHRAIVQSGSVLNGWAFCDAETLRGRSIQLASLLGYRTAEPAQLLAFLMSVDARELTATAASMALGIDDIRGMAIPFRPTAEPRAVGKEAFLTEDPMLVLRGGRFHGLGIPIMAGMTSHEGLIVLKGMKDKPGHLQMLDADCTWLIPDRLQAGKDARSLHELGKSIKEFYFGKRTISHDTLDELVQLNSDLWFTWGIHEAFTQQAALSQQPFYYYQFAFDSKTGTGKKLFGVHDFPGASHADDLQCLFRSSLFDEELDPHSMEALTTTRMVKMWTNFAKVGNPTPDVDADITVVWMPYSPAKPCYLRIDKELTMETDLEKSRMDFWAELYAEHHLVHVAK